jgi:hypothetical protein
MAHDLDVLALGLTPTRLSQFGQPFCGLQGRAILPAHLGPPGLQRAEPEWLPQPAKVWLAPKQGHFPRPPSRTVEGMPRLLARDDFRPARPAGGGGASATAGPTCPSPAFVGTTAPSLSTGPYDGASVVRFTPWYDGTTARRRDDEHR